jgi:ATP-dependent DNA ligase
LSEILSDYVIENYARPSQIEFESWLSSNQPPCLCDCNYGGMRVFLFKSGENLVLVSKNGGLYTPTANPKVFSNMTEFVHAPHRMILDGEYVAGEGTRIFDVLQVDDRDMRRNPLDMRRSVLREIIDGMNLECKNIVGFTVKEILQFRDECVKNGHQGTVVKNVQSRYGEPGSWIELKPTDTLYCFITNREAASENSFRWSLGIIDNKNGKLVNLGGVSSFSARIKPRKIAVGSIVEVKFLSVNSDLELQDPFILRIRPDRSPSECTTGQLGNAPKILKPLGS